MTSEFRPEVSVEKPVNRRPNAKRPSSASTKAVVRAVSQDTQKSEQAPDEELIIPNSPEPIDQSWQNDPKSCDTNLKHIVEAILFSANRAMTVKQVQQVFPELERPDIGSIQGAVDSISEDYRDRPIGLKKLASGYRFQVKEGLSPWVSRLFEEKPPKYSRALLETLSIIAYRQPVTRGEIEDIRGVSVSSNIMRTLLDRDWIRIVAHKEVPGRPALYSTTKQFLDYFNLSSLDELPAMEEIQELDSDVDLNEQTAQTYREREETTPPVEQSEPQSQTSRSFSSADAEAIAPKNSSLH